MFRLARDCNRLVQVIESCETRDQLDTALNMADIFVKKYMLEEEDADVGFIKESVEYKMEELCQIEENTPKIGFLR